MIDTVEINEIIQFKDGDFILDVHFTPEMENVWLTQEQMAELFDINRSSITRHISNIFKNGELDEKTSVRFLHESKNPRNRPPKYYDLDVIIGVGYKVNSKRGIFFRKWANTILKDYLLKGYSINENYYNNTNYIIQVLEEYKSKGGELPTGDTMLEF